MGRQGEKQKKTIDEIEFEQPEPVYIPEKKEIDVELESNASDTSGSLTKYKYFGPILAISLVITGSLNTIVAKWTDTVEIEWKHFNHPFFQGAVMFVGEMVCLVVYAIVLLIQRIHWKRNRRINGPSQNHIPSFPRINPVTFAVPAICDVVNTSVQYIGLNMTSASSYQMLRGSSIIFTGILAILILKNRLQAFRWVGMVTVTIGLAVIGVCDMIWANDADHSSTDIIVAVIHYTVGDLLIVAGEVIHAFQVIVEQKLLNNEDKQKDVPALLAVGLEGFFGLIILAVAMVPLYFIHVSPLFTDNPKNRLEDAINAFWMMTQSAEVTWSLVCNIISIALFNFAGLSVTKFMSATTRMVLDSIRTIVIWAVSIPLFHETFIPLQVSCFFIAFYYIRVELNN
uniref:Solute carrier family 35 member F6 n=1 Tax=Syphacia muris TaxID=451379 RepID=A0A0N5AZQ3_9BILA